MPSGLCRVTVIACLLAAAAVLQGCASASTGEKQNQEMVDKGAVYKNPELQAYVNRVGQRLVAHSDEPDSTFTFTVIDSPDINAFALPGGYVYINRGLLPYLESEAELAGVLAHEIGHVTAGHHSKQQTAGVANKVVATTAYILTGSGELASASDMYGKELASGYGRDMELEADGLGAKFMFQAGYDPDALLEVIGALKDQEQFQRVKANSGGGKPPSSYHGLYATHPRNDQRLQQVIKSSSELDRSTQLDDPSVPGEFQREMEGLVWGESVQSERAANRYYHNKLAFTVELPPQWTVNAGARAIVASAPDGSAGMSISLRRQEKGATPRSVLESGGGSVSAGTELDQAGLKGYTAVIDTGGTSRRVAVINYNNLTYQFTGEAKNFASGDSQLLAMIQSFRPMHPAEFRDGSGNYVHFIQVSKGETIASIAAGVPIANAEAQLRLMNGLYPSGEPRTGDWIKTIR